MADEQDFRIFISWSGSLAKSIARALHAWLPTMFDRVDPWFSDTDIPAGATWFGEIQDRLNSSDYGIIVITTENLSKPWLNFEAGALSKKLGEDIARVTPVLVNFESLTQLTGHPLEQYHAVLLDRGGVSRLCDSIARSANRNTNHVALRFEQMWGKLEPQIVKAKQSAGDQPPPPDVSEPQQLQALTASVRSLEALIRGAPRLPVAQLQLPPEFPLLQRISQTLGTRLINGSIDNDGDVTLVRVEVAEPGLDPSEVRQLLTEIKANTGKSVTLTEHAGGAIRRHTFE